MKTAVIALTKNGSELAVKIGSQFGGDIYVKQEFNQGYETVPSYIYPIKDGILKLVDDIFHAYDSLVFVMACGIAVRAIAPHIKSKTTDPGVVVMDEKGQYVISLLAGHIGGGNKLASEIARITGGVPVITTSTDVNNTISFDVFAVENDCVIENIENLKYISSELVNGGKLGFYTDCRIKNLKDENIVLIPDVEEDIKQRAFKHVVVLSNRINIKTLTEKTLLLRPRNLVLGIGCKRGTSQNQIKLAIEDFLKKNNRSFLSVKYIATIDLKKDEEGLLEYCRETGLELKIIQRSNITIVENNYTCSEFVKKQTGVASVAEPCAVIASPGSRLICGKTVYNGITLALSEEDKEYCL